MSNSGKSSSGTVQLYPSTTRKSLFPQEHVLRLIGVTVLSSSRHPTWTDPQLTHPIKNGSACPDIRRPNVTHIIDSTGDSRILNRSLYTETERSASQSENSTGTEGGDNS